MKRPNISNLTSWIIPHIQNYLAREGGESMSKNNIEKMLRNHPAFAGSVTRFQAGKNEVSGHGILLSRVPFKVPVYDH
ncbi:hypothetical protein [Phaeocystidibacter marisrubri]|uniref:Uncharacterized protein n=1 Tax=Phaeocystidibacter marisrubri TaxID=1577780 RepID=A0A6L3ZDW6_9FLAO|nr:hypothetical protein [Phaeocystidibacter marisrubri]KAB2815816.1 hypothetical protein F8C82_08950 [Phaeocystidibacter marisrubri]